MARKKSSRSTRGRRTRRRRPCDVVPLQICGFNLVIPSDGVMTCDEPVNQEMVLLDGGAFAEMVEASSVLVGPADLIAGVQNMNRGFSWLGAEFNCRFKYNDVTNAWVSSGVTPTSFYFRIACALMLREWDIKKNAGGTVTRAATTLPNLFTRDERFFSGCMYRWDVLLGPILALEEGEAGFLYAIQACDSAGGNAMIQGPMLPLGGWPSNPSIGSGASNQTHHKTRNKRFVDENHYISLCTSIQSVIGQEGGMDDLTSISMDVSGLMKTKQR